MPLRIWSGLGHVAPPPEISSEAFDRAERALWEAGPSAFWLDPDRWFGVEDPHRDMLWEHLHERPGEVMAWRMEPGAINRLPRDRIFAHLAAANEAEYVGRDEEARQLRDTAIAEARRTHV